MRPVVRYASCDGCGETGVSISPPLKRAWEVAAARQLRRCPECGRDGRHVRTERERPDVVMWADAAEHYDRVAAQPEAFADVAALARRTA